MKPKFDFPDQIPPYEDDREVDTRRPWRWRRWLIVALIAILIFIWPAWAGFYTTWLWFQQLGYQTVFMTTLVTKVILALVVGLVTALVIWLNIKLALRLSPDIGRVSRHFVIEGTEYSAPDISQVAKHLSIPAALIIGAFAGMIAWGSWELYLRFRYQVPFGVADPIFGRDIAFYFFTLPALEAISGWLLLLVGVSLVGAAIVYAVRGAVDFSGSRLWINLMRGARAHLLSLFAALFLVFAWQTYLATPNLLFGASGPVSGASYVDVNATLPILYFKAVIALIVAALAIASIFFSSSKPILIGVGLYLLALVAGWIYPIVVQRFSVAPNELVKETPYIQHNIAATRKAFGLDKIEERELSGEKKLTSQDIRDNQRTIKNIRLWDQQPLLDTFAQLQEIRTYYEFQSVDNDRYRINDELRQVMLSPRELASASLPNRNWINEYLTFTHGVGLTLGPVNEVTTGGLPLLYVKDIPPSASVPSLKIDRPEIYFGEILNDRVYVKTSAKEFSYPAGEDNVFKNYEGEGGVHIGSKWRQALFSTRFGDLKLLLSDLLTSESRVLFNRNIRDRLAEIAPYLILDNDPYLVLHEGRLFWMADAYTVSDRYPYSQTINGINYIRNSVKAVVDAYHGHVRLYIADESDPMIQTYARIFPGTLKPLTEMPEEMRAHMRYPEDIFKVQTQVYATYHMDQPQVFYNKEDLWTPASMGPGGREAGQEADRGQTMEPYYTIMKLPGEQTEEFILMLPYTPKSRDNLASWMVARSDGGNYGKLMAYRFPKQKLVFGPKQVVARINQDPEISRQLSLWNQRGSRAEMGTLMVIPIEESLIYVQPLYLRAESGRIPELRRVIVVEEDRIAMEPTLEASLARIFGEPLPAAKESQPELTNLKPGETPTAPPPPVAETRTLAVQAKQHYERALQAQREGNWAQYGEEIKRLGSVIEQMAKER
jgi:uncharacterized membrane protein (UPF0182 family)